jgi:hypothetical protein
MSATEVPPNFIVIFANVFASPSGPGFALLCAAAYIDGVAPRLNPKESRPRKGKTGMKSKTFHGDGPPAIIKAVNDWLAGETGVKVVRTQTQDADPKTATPMRFEVWYEQDAT